LLAARFSSKPTAAVWAPGRVNLIGDHVDYQRGLVLPMAIGLGCACAAAPGGVPGRLRIASERFSEVWEGDARVALEPGEAMPVGHWASYAAGVVAELAVRGGLEGVGLDLALSSSVPIGSGLSSSAAVEVSVAWAVAGLWELALEPLELARLCQRAEHRFAGTPCGLMDQAVGVLGRAGHAVLFDCLSERAEWVPIPEHARWFVVDTGVRHRLADGAYAERRARTERAAAALGVSDLRSVTPEELCDRLRGLEAEAADAARHVVSEIDRVRSAAAALRAGDLSAVGQLMDESHASLRDLLRVSCPELDAVVRVCRSVPGVLGARMTGGGFGGCVVVLADAASDEGLADRLSAGFRRTGWTHPRHPLVVQPGPGAGPVD
tara:strand:- start:3070 stop:4206 length:1137 start_codon:yes stop_codon:yes gene_type:complete